MTYDRNKYADIEALTKKLGAEGGIILHFNTTTCEFGVKSYGHTRAYCGKMKHIANQIFEMIENGTIEIPE